MTDRTLTTPDDLATVAFDDRGLVPVVAQDASDGRVLMMAWANREALELTLATGDVHFWSRSRKALWRKGETSGNVLALRSLHADCDGDTVLARVKPSGPACHTGEDSCFGSGSAPEVARGDVLGELWSVLEKRAGTMPAGSYTTTLLSDENLRLKKLGEECVELVTAIARNETERTAEEAADLVYHLMVALRGAGIDWMDVLGVLEERRRD